MMRRRTFLQAAAATGLASCSEHRHISGTIIGANHKAGHWLRDLKTPPSPTRSIRSDVIVAGCGVSGLIAALRLQDAGIEKISLIDLESEPGGNARCGRNQTTGFPWGAHYVPVPGEEATEVRRILEELGVITGYDAAGRPQYDERHLCGDPQERLFVNGVWQDGLTPVIGVSTTARAEMEHFTARMNDFKKQRGRDGRRPFAIPVDQSSRDAEWLALDSITMDAWMTREGFCCEALRWYVNYCCRDDYGAGIGEVSAWAGLHYFASRDDGDILTWPEGNGWLVKRIMEKFRAVSFHQAVVHRLSNEGGEVVADVFHPQTGESNRHHAKAAVCALPRFIAQRIIPGLAPITTLNYSPWAVANLTWSGEPPPSWDSVFRNSKSLGYVVATHQSLHPFPTDSMLTWYRPLDHMAAPQAREELLNKHWTQWRDEILADMLPAHPDVSTRVSNMDVMLWGHGMIRPVPGFITGEDRTRMLVPQGRIVFAHTDMSGISIFEEACARGTDASANILKMIGKT